MCGLLPNHLDLPALPILIFFLSGLDKTPDQKNVKIGKAGRNRWRGKRPQTRGVAMNPVDHPHGGGEGKTSGGRSPVSPWGQSAKGLKTRRPQRSDKLIITRRKKRKK